MKKRFLCMMLIGCLCLGMTGCGGSGKTETTAAPEKSVETAAAETEKPAETEAVTEAAAEDGMVTISMALALFQEEGEEVTQELVDECMEEWGPDVTGELRENEVVCTMPAETQKTLMEMYRGELDSYYASCTDPEDEDAIKSFIGMETSEDLSQITIKIDKEKYDTYDYLYAYGFTWTGYLYQMMSGVPADQIHVTVSYVTEAGEELYSETSDSLFE